MDKQLSYYYQTFTNQRDRMSATVVPQGFTRMRTAVKGMVKNLLIKLNLINPDDDVAFDNLFQRLGEGNGPAVDRILDFAGIYEELANMALSQLKHGMIYEPLQDARRLEFPEGMYENEPMYDHYLGLFHEHKDKQVAEEQKVSDDRDRKLVQQIINGLRQGVITENVVEENKSLKSMYRNKTD